MAEGFFLSPADKAIVQETIDYTFGRTRGGVGERRRRGGVGSGVFPGLRIGRLTGSTTATFDGATESLIKGTITIREFIPIPTFDPSQSYATDEIVLLGGPAFNDTATYNEHDIVTLGVLAYQANTDLVAGTFDAADWTELGGIGLAYRCTGTYTPRDEGPPVVIASDFPSNFSLMSPAPDVLLDTQSIVLPSSIVDPQLRVDALVKFRQGEWEFVEVNGGSGGGCGEVEFDNRGGLKFRFVQGTDCISPWQSVPVNTCDNGVISVP